MLQYKHKQTGKSYYKHIDCSAHPFKEFYLSTPWYPGKSELIDAIIPAAIVEHGSDWEKVTEILLITEDNVQIKAHDTVYGVRTNYKNWEIIQHVIIKKEQLTTDLGWKWFSSEEKRKEYIKWNEPRYSLFEIMIELTKYGINEDLISLIQTNLNELK